MSRSQPDLNPTGASNRTTTLDYYFDISRIIMLSLAALLTAWCGYQTTRWNGEMAIHFGEASAQRIEANRITFIGLQSVQIEVSLFEAWMDATFEQDSTRAAYYESTMSDDLRAALTAWNTARSLGEPVPSTPFEMPEYSYSMFEIASQLTADAEANFAEGNAANQTGDQYMLITVFLAATLFLVSVSDRFVVRWLRLATLGLSALLLLVVLINVASLPRL